MSLAPLWISLQTASLATVFAGVGGIALANGLFRYRGSWRGVLDGLLTLPVVLPPTVVGFLLLLLLGRYGPVGQLLDPLGITVLFSWPATVVAATVVALPLMYKTVLAAFEQIDPNLLDCARTLGASERRIFWQMMLPLAKSGLLAGIILAFARALGEFGATLMLAGSIPGRTVTMPIAIFLAAEAGDLEQALVWVSVMVVMSLSLITVLHLASQPRQSHHHRHASIASRAEPTITNERPVTADPTLTAVFEKGLSQFTLRVALTARKQPLGLLGASGAGKSMTLRCLAGLETPDRGRIVLNGRVLFDAKHNINLSPAQRRIGFLWQDYALFPHMTVAQNIAFGLHRLPKPARQSQVKAFLALMQLSGLEHHYPHELSGGQQQRVALARALAPQPEALLLDEPIAALDTHLRSHLTERLDQIFSANPRPTLLVTHTLTDAYRLCEMLAVLSEGKVVAAGPKDRIFNQPETSEVAQLVGCQNLSRIKWMENRKVQAIDWNCQLRLSTLPNDCRYIGIQAHHLHLRTTPAENAFPCWIANQSSAPQQVRVYLKLYAPATTYQDYHLQAELSLEQWQMLHTQPLPWFVMIDTQRLVMMRS